MNLKLTKRAQHRVKLVDAWWREHRPEAPTRFVEELDWAKREMLSRPNLAPRHVTASGKACRRLLLPTTEQHVYYTVHPDADLIIVHTVWGLAVAAVRSCSVFPLVALREGSQTRQTVDLIHALLRLAVLQRLGL